MSEGESEWPAPVRRAWATALHVAQGEPPPVAPTLETDHLRLVARGGPWLRHQLQQLLLAEHVDDALRWIHQGGLLAAALPELAATAGFEQEIDRHHKDVWAHTRQVVAQAHPSPAVRWAALLHDIGKVPTRAVTADGKVTFFGHPEASARLFDAVALRLEFPEELRRRVRFVILHHQRANLYDGRWSDSAVRRFYREMGEHLDDLLHLSRADITSAFDHKRVAAARLADELEARIAQLRELDDRQPPLPSGMGHAIGERFALPPGRAIGELKRDLEAMIEAGALEPHREASYYLDALARADEAKRPK